MGSESGQLSVLLSQFGDLLMGGGEVLGASSSVLEAGHLAVLWLMLPCLSTIAAGRMELRPQEELPSCWRDRQL